MLTWLASSLLPERLDILRLFVRWQWPLKAPCFIVPPCAEVWNNLELRLELRLEWRLLLACMQHIWTLSTWLIFSHIMTLRVAKASQYCLHHFSLYVTIFCCPSLNFRILCRTQISQLIYKWRAVLKTMLPPKCHKGTKGSKPQSDMRFVQIALPYDKDTSGCKSTPGVKQCRRSCLLRKSILLCRYSCFTSLV